MAWISSSTRCAWRGVATAAVLTLAGCSLNWPDTITEEPPATVVDVTPEPSLEPVPEVAVQPEPEPEPVPEPWPAEPLPAVAIVLTDRHPAYTEVADELTKRLEDYTLYELGDGSQPPVVTLRMVNDSESAAVVAIGLRAAKSSVAMAGVPVVFSQVFNYTDNGLITDSSRGVAALPPLEPQIAAWKKLNPKLRHVGVILGENQDILVDEAIAAAAAHHVDLHVRTSRSDQETLYHFKRMIRDIDGFWLFPDNRILSQRVLEEIFGEAHRHSVQVSAFNESMLSMGATLSASTIASNVAATIVTLLRQIQAGNIEQLPALSRLSEIRIVTSDDAPRRSVPDSEDASRLRLAKRR